MGFFKKIFEKKVCDICGGEIGLLGNRKLEDGNMCKECAKKLSPWFDDRRNSTIAQINEQLAYREANKAKVAAFRTTRSFGTHTMLYLDEDAGNFMVTSADSAREKEEANPDVLAFTDVTGVILDVDDRKEEVKRKDKDGNEVSFVPARYIYYYDFYIKIQVNNPYFDDMRFKLNGSSIEIERTGIRQPDPVSNSDYRYYKDWADEIKKVLMESRQQARDDVAAAAAPKAAVKCPYCDATTTPDEKGCCEYCGGAING